MIRRKKRTNEDITTIYSEAYEFLTSQEHCAACTSLQDIPKPQKLSSKLFFWLLENEFKKEADVIVAREEAKLNKESWVPFAQLSSAALAKIRHVASACLHKILSRLRAIVVRNLGRSSVQSKSQRDWSYKLHRLLKGLRISEESAIKTTSIPESMYEIEFRQGPTRGLLHVSDQVFLFFSNAHIFLQRFLSAKAFHVFDNKIHLICRQNLFTNDSLLQEWNRLFAPGSPDDDDNTFNCMTDELYGLVMEHFLRISIADGLHAFKIQIPKTKKQALRCIGWKRMQEKEAFYRGGTRGSRLFLSALQVRVSWFSDLDWRQQHWMWCLQQMVSFQMCKVEGQWELPETKWINMEMPWLQLEWKGSWKEIEVEHCSVGCPLEDLKLGSVRALP